jgi:hypothetical protein
VACAWPSDYIHSVGSPEIAHPVPVVTLLPKPPWTELPVVAQIGAGAKTGIMCGFLHCDDMLFDPILRALPRLIHLRSTGSSPQCREASLRYLLERANLPGGSELSAQFPKMVLVDCLRQYVEAIRPAQTSWLAALKDPLVGPAIARLRAAPAETWNATRLAHELAVSRSPLAKRFTEAIGQPPMRYLRALADATRGRFLTHDDTQPCGSLPASATNPRRVQPRVQAPIRFVSGDVARRSPFAIARSCCVSGYPNGPGV